MIAVLLASCAYVLASATAFAGPAGPASPCGTPGCVPSDAVAEVGNVAIAKSAFDHWLVIAQRSASAGTSAQRSPAPLDPPDFAACVAYHQRTDPKPHQGQPAPTPALLEMRCKREFNAARDHVMSFLITADWLMGEAADQGIGVSDAEAAKDLERIEAQRFPTAAALQQFLARSGETSDDLVFRVRIDILSNRLRQKTTGAKITIGPAEIRAFYNRNARRFRKQTVAQATPLIRRLLISQHQQQALTAFAKHFRAKWRGRTTCAAGYVVAECANAPG